MRRTASRAHSSEPMTLMPNMRCERSTLISSTRAATSTTPALLTRPPSAAELGVDGGEHRQHLGLVGDVGLHDQRAPAGARDMRRDGVRGVGVARVVDGDVPAVAGGAQGGGGADAAAAAGDEEDSVHAPMLGASTAR